MPNQTQTHHSRVTGMIGATIAAVTLSLVAIGCGGGGGGSSSGTTTTAKAPTPTTTAKPATTTTTQPATPSVPISVTLPASGPGGSGCTPPGTTLPDGLWYGQLKSVDAAAGSIGFDLACIYSNAAAKAAGVAPSNFPLNDFTTNVNPQVFTVPAWSNVQVLPIEVKSGGPTGGLAPAQTGVAAASTILGTHDGDMVWVQVTGGKAIVIQQMFRS